MSIRGISLGTISTLVFYLPKNNYNGNIEEYDTFLCVGVIFLNNLPQKLNVIVVLLTHEKRKL